LKANPAGTKVLVHDDGSLSEADEQSLCQDFPAIRVVRRRIADELMASALTRYPRLRRYRAEHPLALKLLDVVLLSAEPIIAYCDTDILFYRPALGLFKLPERANAVFTCDMYNSYSLRSWQIYRQKIACCRYVNSGLFVVNRSILDLDRLEWVLGLNTPPVLNHYREQTAWAILAANASTLLIHPDDVRIVNADSDVSDLIAGHYVATFRKRLASDIAKRLACDTNVGGRHLRYLPTSQCTALEMLRYEVSRRLARYLPTQNADRYVAVTSELTASRIS